MSLKGLIISALHGFLLAIVFFLLIMSAHEDSMYDQIVDSVISDGLSDQEIAIRLVDMTHTLLEDNHAVLASSPVNSLRHKLFNSSDIQLVSPKGNCGSYAHVLARLLQRADFKVRIAQMECSNGEVGCHIMVDALIDGRFVALDGMYGLHFVKESGELATYYEVGRDWKNYSKQLPANYPKSFDYYGVRYANWNKVPVIMPFFKRVLKLFIGNSVEELSIRPYFLNLYKAYLILIWGCYVLVFGTCCLVIFIRRKECHTEVG